MKSILNLRYLLALAVCFTLLASCSEDDPVDTEITGCTDETAENYNPDATQSDNNCVYSRDKFIGVYIGSITFMTLDQLDQTDIEFMITPGIASDNQVLVQIDIQGAPLTLDGEAMGNEILVDYENTIPNGGIFNSGLEGVPVDLTFKGTVSTSDDGANIGGALDVTVVGEVMGFPFTIDDVGTLTGMKQ